MDNIKEQLPSAILSGLTGIIVDKALGYNISSNVKFFGVSMPRYASTLINVGAGSIVGGYLVPNAGPANINMKLAPIASDSKMNLQKLGAFGKPIVGGAVSTAIGYFNKMGKPLENFLSSAGSIYIGNMVNTTMLKKKAQ